MYLFEDELEMNEFVKFASAEEIQEAYDILLENNQPGEFIKLSSKAAFYKAFQAGEEGLAPEETINQVVEVAVESEPISAPEEQEKTITERDAKEIAKEVVKAQHKVEGMTAGAGAGAPGVTPGAGGAGAGAGTEEVTPEEIQGALAGAGVLPT